jgi:hypothetical protein
VIEKLAVRWAGVVLVAVTVTVALSGPLLPGAGDSGTRIASAPPAGSEPTFRDVPAGAGHTAPPVAVQNGAPWLRLDPSCRLSTTPVAAADPVFVRERST